MANYLSVLDFTKCTLEVTYTFHSHRYFIPVSFLTQPPGCNICSKEHCSSLADKFIVDLHSSHLLLSAMESKNRNTRTKPAEHSVQILNLGKQKDEFGTSEFKIYKFHLSKIFQIWRIKREMYSSCILKHVCSCIS